MGCFWPLGPLRGIFYGVRFFALGGKADIELWSISASPEKAHAKNLPSLCFGLLSLATNRILLGLASQLCQLFTFCLTYKLKLVLHLKGLIKYHSYFGLNGFIPKELGNCDKNPLSMLLPFQLRHLLISIILCLV